MKKLLFMFLLACIALPSLATTYVVYVTTERFLPDTLRNIVPGDVITWVWQSGLQTTSSTSIPKNAPSWNAEISKGNSTFSYTVPNIEGWYSYRSNYNPTGVTGAFIVGSTTKVNTQSKLTVLCAPNPVSGTLHLTFEATYPNRTVSLCDITGRAVLSKQYAAKETDIDVSSLPGGLYFLKTEEQDGSVSTQRVQIIH